MRVYKPNSQNDVYYLFSDHLGSTSEGRYPDGTLHSQQWYKAFGEMRYQDGAMPTGRKYTGQLEIEFGLYHFGARVLDPALGRWLQPDTLIPNPMDPISWDRFSYGLNNPSRYIDPTGHFNDDQLNNWFCNGEEGCNWRDQFNEYWQKILLKGEFGDAVAYSWNEGIPVFAIFALEDGMLVGWDMSSKNQHRFLV